MMYLNKIYSNSNDHISGKSSSTDRFDIELQDSQPRRRQTMNDDHNQDQYYASSSRSIPAKQEEFLSSKAERLSPINNNVEIPRNISTISSPDPILISSLPVVVEEK
ncbi:unnamed protein product [Rotaria sp. Silwood1]|nr:unnamed protein product [Rotaria sp. Silwood1]CAF0784259.1 unnamed protein product [Rotaria sp. Silwood1]CAF3338618.1 unnamed protein product [Rotaria sp. Silwood1]CAF3343331.1 unnamed protein product [Rotaria sp. Silwood1]